MFARLSARFAVFRTARDACSGSRCAASATIIVVALGLFGCAPFSPDAGMSVVSDITGSAIGKDVVFVRSAEDAAWADGTVRRLLSRPLTADAAVQVALLNNRGLQAAYNDLALAEADAVQQSLPPNPVFSISSISGDAASEVERQVAGDILALATLPFRSDIARDRFRQAQLKASLETLRLAGEVRRAYYKAIAANELAALLSDAKATAEAAAHLAEKLGETGSISKLDQAREQVFDAEIAAELGTARQEMSRSRERLARLLGLTETGPGFRLPDRLPPLPVRPRTSAAIESDAVGHRIDLQIARLELVALAKSLDLTEATRFVTLLDLAGIDRRTTEPGVPPFRERGFDIQFQIPIFDGGEVRVRQAAETYRRAYNRLSEKAVNIRSEAREAYRTYRSAYDIASRYQRKVLPLRQIITGEMQLRLSSMQVDIFALVSEARQRVASERAAIEARRAFWIAQSELLTALNGGGSGEGSDGPLAAPLPSQAANGSY
jgi:outer membrane protein TolC